MAQKENDMGAGKKSSQASGKPSDSQKSTKAEKSSSASGFTNKSNKKK